MIRFALAKAADVPRLRALVERAYRGDTAKQGWTHEADLLDDERTNDGELAEAIANERVRVLLAEIGGKLAGTVTIRDVGDGRAYLGMLCVDPELQAAGLGRALIADAEDMAKEAFDAKIIEMTVIDARADLIAYYERRGYSRSGETRAFPNSGFSHLRMAVLERSLR
ncbi:MAG: GNAT family N-acetyltransferase [Novosphingobium sp. 17-62-19]|uniref:GNAT family N-acetyltransferase n=1 Tax=Novosphingobium sp. 17-62-19 TaxID=1970406 RepID=UPI000BD311F4|nr:GNAT family N-acetyltransferase [Novosphingobium sp. 17-62-19]OZA19059.1 MAG: GNAT family N-acetyltransferase [Novosphingobium sp. 17-62-19]OZA64233.1 MAG: GNAT family N-acetyltransferase [Sphingomonadales bacterium 39-62-4]HQS97258.1 GNAT family N-acetyltransferase [Novosphingobium sp.]